MPCCKAYPTYNFFMIRVSKKGNFLTSTLFTSALASVIRDVTAIRGASSSNAAIEKRSFRPKKLQSPFLTTAEEFCDLSSLLEGKKKSSHFNFRDLERGAIRQLFCTACWASSRRTGPDRKGKGIDVREGRRHTTLL